MARAGVTLLLVSASLLRSAGPLDAAQPLSVRVTPVMAGEPAIVHVTAVIDTDARNRSLEISASSRTYFRSSQVQLEGDDARRVYDFEFRDVPRGHYDLTAVLTGTDGRRTAVTRVFVVMSAPGR